MVVSRIRGIPVNSEYCRRSRYSVKDIAGNLDIVTLDITVIISGVDLMD